MGAAAHRRCRGALRGMKRSERPHHVVVAVLVSLAVITGFVGVFAVWANRQALNTDNWTDTSGKLLENKQIQSAVSAFLVNELFSNVDVAAELRSVLPPQASPLAGAPGAAARGVAQQKLGLTLPPSSGEIEILRSDELDLAQSAAKGVRHLAVVFTVLPLLLFAAAIALAGGWRRVALRTTGWCFVGI